MTAAPLFRVNPDVFERFPTYTVGCVAATGISSPDQSRIDELLRTAELRARASYEGIDLKTVEQFATWREAFSAAGWSPSRFPASVEALHKRIQRGDTAPRINPAVDLANAAVLYYATPVGTHDIDTFNGQPLEVRWANENDQFIDVSGNTESRLDSEVVYAVGNDIRTRRWVWRQGKNGLVSPDATSVFYPIDGFSERTLDAVEAAVNFVAETCATAMGATVTQGLVTADHSNFRLDD